MHSTTIFPSLFFPFLFSPSLGRRNFEDARALPSVKRIFSLGAEKNHVSRAFLLANGLIFFAVSRDACSGIVHAHTIPGKFLFLLAMKTQNVMGTFGPVVCHN